MDVHPVPLCRMRVLGTVFTCASRWWAQSYSVPVFQKGTFLTIDRSCLRGMAGSLGQCQEGECVG